MSINRQRATKRRGSTPNSRPAAIRTQPSGSDGSASAEAHPAMPRTVKGMPASSHTVSRNQPGRSTSRSSLRLTGVASNKEIVREVVCQTHGGRGRSRLASSWSGVASLPHAGAHSASFIAVAGPLRSESTQSTFGFRLPSATESMWSRYASPAPLGKRNLTKSVAIPTGTPEAVNEFDPCIGTRDDKPRLPLHLSFFRMSGAVLVART
jgi:hypothetical protein